MRVFPCSSCFINFDTAALGHFGHLHQLILGLGTDLHTFNSTNQITLVVHSRSINQCHILVPESTSGLECNLQTYRIYRERDHVTPAASSCQWVRTMASRKLSRVVTLSKLHADDTCCNICDAKCKAGQGNTSNLRRHLVKHKIHPKRWRLHSVW